jgi:hypothetical protein
VWHDDRDGNYETYYKRSGDGGTSWGADTRVTNNVAASMFPSIAISASTLHLVWFDTRDTPNVEIYYNRSTDEGLSWGTDVQLTNSALSSYPSVAVSGSVVHVIWQDNRDGNNEIYYKRNPTGDPVGIKEPIQSGNTIQISPNPFTNEIIVNNSRNELCEISIYDITSRKVAYKKFTNTATLNTSQLARGIYIFEVKNKNTVLSKGKIIKD